MWEREPHCRLRRYWQPSTNSASPSSIDVVTYHYDNCRTGQNTHETILTPMNVNSTTNGIVWAVENGNTGVLHAYDASNVGKEFYNSNQASSARDQFADNKFITPMVANGRVYVGTPTSVAVFGLLPEQSAP